MRQQHQSYRSKITRRGFNLPLTVDEVLKRIGIEYLRDVKHRGMDFDNTENLRRQARGIAKFLVEEKEKFGLLICGNVGNGKSTMARSILKVVNGMVDEGLLTTGERFPWDYMAMVDAREMVRIYIRDYDEEFRLLKSRKYLIIDDLGTDQKEVVLYGTVFNPFMELLDYRYEKLLPTIVVSNLNAHGISEKYGDPRLPDRMREMFRILVFGDGSFRR